MDQKEHERGHGRGWEPILPEGEVVVEREGKHFQEGEGGVLSVNEAGSEDDVQQLECAKGIAFREELLGDDALERGNRAAQEQNHEAAHRSVHLGVRADRHAHISCTHEHRSQNDGNEGKVHTNRKHFAMEEVLQNAGKHGHGTAEHLRLSTRKRQNLVQCETVVLQAGIGRNNVHDKDHTHEEQHFHFIGLDRTVLEESGRNVLHDGGVDCARDHVYLLVMGGPVEQP